ncbi:GNAT family N-acetyltransferase [Nitratireductor basaltis]|uniref:GCN5-related N-acetyltransferase n=1 Tax=Nitratireductor basaltis TaxID=472175 RepID=A0A084U626_9HYPH|nr:GNAT family N-acetyltransferase [Nitratireductor basaltis]KFB08412.1 GCN5-related N-acetyltransferase [Nitratireductor basaltis]
MASDGRTTIFSEGGIEVSLAGINDANAVLAMQDLLFPGDPNSLTEGNFSEAIASEAATVLVARQDGETVGFCLLRDRGLRPWTGVDLIGVGPAAQGQGIGRILLQAACSQARRPVIRLFVRPDNERAQALYTGMGFRQTGSRKGNYDDGADAIIMMKWLGPRSFRRNRDNRA